MNFMDEKGKEIQENIRRNEIEQRLKKRDEYMETLFGDLNPERVSTKYIKLNRINHDKTKIVVRISDRSGMFKTKYGFCLILNKHTVCWLQPFQVSMNYYGNEVMLFRSTFFPANAKLEYDGFPDTHKYETFDEWVEIAQAQESMLVEEMGEVLPKYPCYWKIY